MKPTRAVRTAPRAPFACGDPRRDTGHDPLAKPAQQPRYPLHRHRPQRRGKVGFTSAALRAHAAILPRRLGGRCAVEGTPARLPPIPVPVSLQPPPHALLPPGCPRPARHPDHLCAGDRRSDHASLIRGVASSRSLVSGLREHRPLTHAAGRGTMPMTVLGGGAPGALHSKSGLCEPERTPAARPRPHRATGDDADGASPRAAEPCEPRQVGRSSGKRPAPGATRGLGRSHHPRHGRPGRDNACARSLPSLCHPTPPHPPHTRPPPAACQRATRVNAGVEASLTSRAQHPPSQHGLHPPPPHALCGSA